MLKIFLESIRKADIILVVMIILLALFSGFAILQMKGTNSTYAVCEIDGKVICRIDLHKPQKKDLKNGMEIEVKKGKIRVTKSDCPEQICVKHSWLKLNTDIIVCAPNKCIIYFEGEGQFDYISK